MEDFQKIEAVSRVKRDLLELLKSVEEEDATVAITRNGEAVGVLMSWACWRRSRSWVTRVS